MALTLFLYHSVDPGGSFLSVTPDQFRRQIAGLVRSNRRVLTVAQAAAAMARGDRLTDAACITFDDAYQSVAEHAWPILRDHGLSATVYCVSGLMGQQAHWLPRLFPAIFGTDDAAARTEFERRIGMRSLKDAKIAADPIGAFRRAAALPIMTWDTARDLTREGMDPGGHTLTHPYLTQLEGAALADEIANDRHALQDRLGCTVASFAYPFGDQNPQTRRAVAAAGYAVAVTARAGAVRDPAGNAFEWRRIGVWPAVGGWKMRLYLSSLYGFARGAV